MKKIFLGIAALLFQIMPLNAITAFREMKSFTQSDGTIVQLELVGDEFFHYYLTSDGYVAMCKDKTSFYYAKMVEDSLVCTNQLVHNPALRSIEEVEILSQVATQETASAQWKRQLQEGQKHRLAIKKAKGTISLTGRKRGLVLLVNFTDIRFSSSKTPLQFYDDFFNKEGFSGSGMTGSVRDYFLSQSYGQFDLIFDVIGPLTVSHHEAYYGANNSNGNDSRPAEMVAEACKMADAKVNFKDYDWDNDGEVDQVFVIYAGFAESYTGSDPNTIWPHSYSLASDYLTVTADGVKINKYACGSELKGSSGTTPEGIGTACHEFSHCLGLMDMYDTSGGNNFGMGQWSLMASGNYNNNGRTPSAYTAFERWSCGWLKPKEINEVSYIRDMKPITDAPEAYVLYNENYRNEYYILENRQVKGWDAGQYGHGLTVMHIDYDEQAWSSNSLNVNKNHQRATLIPADNSLSDQTVAGDPFPGTSKKTSLTDSTTPATTLFNKNLDGTFFMGKPIEDIQESEEGLISFACMRGIIAAPLMHDTERISDTSFRISWDPVENATSYEITMQERKAPFENPADAVMIKENFEGCYSKSNGMSNIANKLDNYLQTKGWTGTNLYTSPNLLKMGKGEKLGTICTPMLDAPNNGELTIVYKLKPYNDSSKTFNVFTFLSLAGGDRMSANIPCDKEDYYLVTADEVEEDFQISIEPQAMAYITEFTIYDGLFDKEQLGIETEDETEENEVAPRRARRKVKSVTYTSPSPYLELTDMNPTSTYYFHVRAITTMGNSQWTPEFTVERASSVESAPSYLEPLTSDSYFDMQGRKVSRPTIPGIYIHNGRKKFYTK